MSFAVPAACYLFVLFFGLKYAGMYDANDAPVAARGGH
jgi:hypothetical protein